MFVLVCTSEQKAINLSISQLRYALDVAECRVYSFCSPNKYKNKSVF